MSYIIGVDIGGTFTDLIVFDKSSRMIVDKIKILSTPKAPQEGVRRAFDIISYRISKASIIAHATTIATNALLGQQKLDLPKVALITTKGFRDIIEIGRQRRPEIYNLFF